MVYTFREGRVCVVSFVGHSLPRFSLPLKQQRLCLLLSHIGRLERVEKLGNVQVFEEVGTRSRHTVNGQWTLTQHVREFPRDRVIDSCQSYKIAPKIDVRRT